MVCADSPEEAAALAHLKPTMIMAEPSDLIGGSDPVAKQQEFIAATIAAVRRIDRDILIFNSAGIRRAEDAAAVINAGADGAGSTSGVLTAADHRFAAVPAAAGCGTRADVPSAAKR